MVGSKDFGGWLSLAVAATWMSLPGTVTAQTASPPVPVSARSANDTDLARAIAEAVTRDPAVRAARAELGVAEVERDMARNGYLPALNASAGPESSGVGYDVSLSQTLYDWGQVRAGIRRAGHLVDRQMATLRIARDDVALEVAELWLDIAAGRAKVTLVQDHLQRLGRLQTMAQERVEGRFSDRAELGRASLAVSTASALRAELSGSLVEAEEAFTVLVGRDAGRVRLPDMPGFLIPLRAAPVLEEAIVASPLYMRSTHEARAAETTVREAEAARYPRLVLEGSVQRREIGGRLIDDSSVGLRFRMNTQQGLSTFQRPRLEAARAEAARMGIDSTARELKRTVSSLVTSDRALQGRIDALSDQVSQSDGVRGLYAEQFVVGQRDIQDLIIMESEYFEAERQILDLTVERIRNHYRAAAQLGLLADSFVSVSGTTAEVP